MQARKTIAAAFLILIAGSLAALIRQATLSSPLPASTPIPQLSYRDASGAHVSVVRGTPTQRTAIVLFSSKCPHCLYELDAFERRLSEVQTTRLYFLTTEAALPSALMSQRWPALSASHIASWGTVRARDFQSSLHTLLTPAIFVFDEEGRLLSQFRGETKFDLLVPALTGAKGD